MKNLDLRLTVSNLLDQAYYGVGRQSGSSDISLWDADTLPDSLAFTPPYHPRLGGKFSWACVTRSDAVPLCFSHLLFHGKAPPLEVEALAGLWRQLRLTLPDM